MLYCLPQVYKTLGCEGVPCPRSTRPWAVTLPQVYKTRSACPMYSLEERSCSVLLWKSHPSSLAINNLKASSVLHPPQSAICINSWHYSTFWPGKKLPSLSQRSELVPHYWGLIATRDINWPCVHPSVFIRILICVLTFMPINNTQMVMIFLTPTEAWHSVYIFADVVEKSFSEGQDHVME